MSKAIFQTPWYIIAIATEVQEAIPRHRHHLSGTVPACESANQRKRPEIDEKL